MWEIRISEFFYCPNTIFGLVFDCIGESPAVIPIIYFSCVLGGLLLKKKSVVARKSSLIGLSCYLVCVLVLSVTVVGTIKHLWGRVRFCDLTPPNYDEYTPFYLLGSGGRSFPSGHASMSALSFLLIDVNSVHNVFKKRKVVAFACIFTFLTCLSRLMEGAHFITDLIFGVLITLSIRFLLRKFFLFLKHKLHAKSHRQNST